MFPLRIDRKSRAPVELEISLKNQNSLNKLISYEIVFPEGISVNTKNKKGSEIFKLGEMVPDEVRTFKYKLLPTSYLGEGTVELIVRAYEHIGSYDNLEQTTEKRVQIRVV